MIRKKRLCSAIILGSLFFLIQAVDGHASGLDKYLKDRRLIVGGIQFIPVTIRDGMESQITARWPLEGQERVFQGVAYRKNEKRVKALGGGLRGSMGEYYVAGVKDDKLFLLFYNFITANGCQNDYIIQKVKLNKVYYDYSGIQYKEENQYLLEVIRLNFQKETEKADEHYREYALGKASRRRITVDLEVGCGKIPGVLEKAGWPYEPTVLQYTLQNYSERPELYEKVKFNFSANFRYSMIFDRRGHYSVEIPEINK